MKFYILDTSLDPRTYNPCLKRGLHSRHKIDPELLVSVIRNLRLSLSRFI